MAEKGAAAAEGLAHPGWFGGVMGTAALSRALVATDFGRFEAVAWALSWALLGLALVMGVAAAAGLSRSLRRSDDRLRDRVVAPVLGPLYAAIPGSVFVLWLALLSHAPHVADSPSARTVVLALVAATLVAGLWLTITFFVAAFEQEDFEAQSISGTWFLPETVVLLAVLVLFALTEGAQGGLRTSLAAVTIAVTGIGFVLFLLTAALFFSRLVLVRQHHEPGVAAMWIMMSPLSVSSLALGAAAAVLPALVDVPEGTVVALVSLGSGLLWGFGLWWLVASLVLTFHQGRRSLIFSPGSWAYVFPLSAISLASADLARIWGSGLVAGVAVLLVLCTTAVWLMVAVGGVRWLRRGGVPRGNADTGTVA